MLPFPAQVGHLKDLKMFIDENEFLIIDNPIVVQDIPQASRALPKPSEDLAPVVVWDMSLGCAMHRCF
jgi:hypothetical protein